MQLGLGVMKTRESSWRRAALAALLLTAMGPLRGQAQSTNLLSGGDTVFVTYDNGTSGPEAGVSPTINLGFGDSTTYSAVVMDTGSTGIVVSADLFTPASVRCEPNARKPAALAS